MDSQEYITIPLSKRGKHAGKYEALISLEDSDLASQDWKVQSDNYASKSIKRNDKWTTISMHRIVMQRIVNRKLQSHEQIDHINGNGFDNRRSNLRLATPSQNCGNQSIARNNSTGYKGVTYNKKRDCYTSRIAVKGKRKFLGSFQTPELAHEAYCKAAKEHFGEFANSGD